MLAQRLLSAAVGVPLLIAVIVAGGTLYNVILALALGGAVAEFLLAAGLQWRQPVLWLWALTAALLPLVASQAVAPDALLAGAILLWLALLVVVTESRTDLRGWLLAAAAGLYVGWLGQHLALLRQLNDGRGWVFLAIFTTFASDTGAYVVGRLAGRHPLAPAVSPNKTVEGAIGGLVIAALTVPVLARLLGLGRTWPALLVAGAGMSMVAQLGDLAESALKRALAIKDAGRLVPGHGGLLDRLDSLLFVGAVLYYWVRWIRP